MSSGKTYNHSDPITGRTNLNRNTSAEESENGHHTSEMVISDGNSYDLERAAATHLHRYQASDMLLNHPGLVFSSSHMQNHSRQLNRYGFNNNNENKDLSPNRGRKTPSLESLSNSHGTSNRSQSVDGDSKKDSDTKTKKRSSSAEDLKQDQTYWEKRRKNNESAKRSRDARRMKEEQIAMRVVYLEQENLQLRTEAQLLKNEIDKLRCMLYNAQ